MSDDVLLRTKSIEITTKIARFESISYQISNIGSVGVYSRRKLNAIAVILFGLGVAAAYWALKQDVPMQQRQISGPIALTLGVAALIIQMFWPRKLFTFILRTSSNDVHKIESTDGEELDAIQAALEGAFIAR